MREGGFDLYAYFVVWWPLREWRLIQSKFVHMRVAEG
jgi:hypothetical protein